MWLGKSYIVAGREGMKTLNELVHDSDYLRPLGGGTFAMWTSWPPISWPFFHRMPATCRGGDSPTWVVFYSSCHEGLLDCARKWYNRSFSKRELDLWNCCCP